MRRLLPMMLLLLILMLAGCGDDEGDGGGGGETTAAETETAPADTTAETTAETADGCEEATQPSAKKDGGETKPKSELESGKDYLVNFETNCGSFTVDVDEQGAGLTAASFVQLAESGFYENTFFHRIVPNFVIQGGDPTGSGSGGPGYTTRDAPGSDAAYVKGTVAMAKAGDEPAGSAGSQFFVVTDDEGGQALTPDYAIVGDIAKGLDTIERIGKLGDVSEQPTQVVLIERVSVRVK